MTTTKRLHDNVSACFWYLCTMAFFCGAMVDAFAVVVPASVSLSPHAASLAAGPKATASRGRQVMAATVASSDAGSLNGLNPNQQPQQQQAHPVVGLYRPVADWVWDKIQTEFPTLRPVPDAILPPRLQYNEAPAKGAAIGTVVRITIRALKSHESSSCPIRYARMALLETIVPTDDSSLSLNNSMIHTTGIQVLNLVLFPRDDNNHHNWPVWGADFVSLPGGRHLILLDAQPMTANRTLYQAPWQEWYERHVVQSDSNRSRGQDDEALLFPWGGDFPLQVQPYVSPTALWTRFVSSDSKTTTNGTALLSKQQQLPAVTDSSSLPDPLERIQGPLITACREHLDIYCRLLLQQQGDSDTPINLPQQQQQQDDDENHQDDYIAYRLANDPARPMLKSLYGEEWTEQVLHQVLFPPLTRPQPEQF